MMSAERNKVFISYNHHDSEWAEQICQFLNIILAGSDLIVWSDAKIMPGEGWDATIKQAIETTRVAVLLISPSYLASQFTREFELRNLLKFAEQNEINILPIMVESCRIEPDSSLAKYQPLNSTNKPLSSLSDLEKEQFFINLGKIIYELTGKLITTGAANFAFKSKGSDISNIFFEAEKKIKIKS
jgi:hypothetical protein